MTTSEDVKVAVSLGQKLCAAFQAVTPPSGHLGEALQWSDWDATGQTVFENAAVHFLARLSYDETVAASLASKDEEIAVREGALHAVKLQALHAAYNLGQGVTLPQADLISAFHAIADTARQALQGGADG